MKEQRKLGAASGAVSSRLTSLADLAMSEKAGIDILAGGVERKVLEKGNTVVE